MELTTTNRALRALTEEQVDVLAECVEDALIHLERAEATHRHQVSEAEWLEYPRLGELAKKAIAEIQRKKDRCRDALNALGRGGDRGDH